MSKSTMTMYEYLISELSNRNISESFDVKTTQLTIGMQENSYVEKILTYDEDVEDILNKRIFRGIKLSTPEHDKEFKQIFLNKFLNHEIDFQTIEEFSVKVMSLLLQYKRQLDDYFQNLDNYLSNKNISTGDDDSVSDSSTRNATQSLAQQEINLDVENHVMRYADDNAISLNRSKNKGNKKSESNSYNFDVLLQSLKLLETILNQFQKKCFLRWGNQ